MGTVDTFNKFLVSLRGDALVVVCPPGRLTKAEALNLAAYLVTMAEVLPGDETWEETIAAVQNA